MYVDIATKSALTAAMAAMFFVVSVFGSMAAAGELDRKEITDYRTWRANRCYKPPPPQSQVTDALSFNLAVEAFNRYLGEMRTYLECVNDEANEDYAAMKKVLEDGLAQMRQDAVRELEVVRNNVEQYRRLYADPPNTAESPR